MPHFSKNALIRLKWDIALCPILVKYPRRLPDIQGEFNSSQAEQSEAKWSRYLSGLIDCSSRIPHFSKIWPF